MPDNVIRHAAATRADILIRPANAIRAGRVRVTVRDNGKGIAQRNEREATRFGLMGCAKRVQALDGMFQIDNRRARA